MTSYSDIGKISFEFLYSPNSLSLGQSSKYAYPIFNFVKQYPVLGEIVLIIQGPSPELNDDFSKQRLFYFPPYSLWNSVNHNSFPNMEEYAGFLLEYKQHPGAPGDSQTNMIEFPKGYSFKESESIRNLTPFEGDTILESRYGQSIRFGSTIPQMAKLNHWSNSGNLGDPIMIIRNGQGIPTFPLDKFATTVEDINSDKSSIYLTAGQEINIDDLSEFPLDSFGISINSQVQNVITITQPILSNETVDASSQDLNVFNK